MISSARRAADAPAAPAAYAFRESVITLDKFQRPQRLSSCWCYGHDRERPLIQIELLPATLMSQNVHAREHLAAGLEVNPPALIPDISLMSGIWREVKCGGRTDVREFGAGTNFVGRALTSAS